MIYVGYQGIGKSTLAGKNNCIDLESGNFWVDGERSGDWYKIYCNIAEHLSEQGYNVFTSSHKVVIDELIRRNVEFITVVPSTKLKDEWIKRLQERFDRTGLLKDYKALMNAKDNYTQNIKNITMDNSIVIEDMNYDLYSLISERK